MSALLSANELRLSYGYQTLLDGVTLAVSAGEKVGLVGRNGCGKTSLLKILTGQQAADSGEISLRRSLRVGYLPQEFELDPALSIYDNIASGAADLVEAIRRYEHGEGSEAELADLLHLIEHADGWNLDARIKAISTALGTAPLETTTGPLSGGEKRRLAIARSLCSDPKVLMLDEPFAGIDPIAVEDIQRIVRELREKDDLAILITDHSVRETLSITDRAFLIHDGRVILEGASDELVDDPIARKYYLGEDFKM